MTTNMLPATSKKRIQNQPGIAILSSGLVFRLFCLQNSPSTRVYRFWKDIVDNIGQYYVHTQIQINWFIIPVQTSVNLDFVSCIKFFVVDLWCLRVPKIWICDIKMYHREETNWPKSKMATHNSDIFWLHRFWCIN